MRGATVSAQELQNITQFQSTRPMRGATFGRLELVLLGSVSIHAPHAGRDYLSLTEFISILVSIHAPHAGRDRRRAMPPSRPRCFNPRAPCGARLGKLTVKDLETMFQSTRPMRGATSYAQAKGATQ